MPANYRNGRPPGQDSAIVRRNPDNVKWPPTRDSALRACLLNPLPAARRPDARRFAVLCGTPHRPAVAGIKTNSIPSSASRAHIWITARDGAGSSRHALGEKRYRLPRLACSRSIYRPRWVEDFPCGRALDRGIFPPIVKTSSPASQCALLRIIDLIADPRQRDPAQRGLRVNRCAKPGEIE